MSDTTGRVGGVTIKREVGLGEIVILAVTLVGLVLYFGRGEGDTKALAVQIANLTSSVARVEGGVSSLTSDVRMLPSLKERLDAMDREVNDGKARDGAQDVEIKNLRERVIGLGADVTNMRAASAVPLPGPRR